MAIFYGCKWHYCQVFFLLTHYQPCSVYGKHGSSFASYVTSTKNVVIFIAHNGVKPFLNSYSNA